MKFGDEGRLHAINPEFGFFGVAPGTNESSNPNAMHTMDTNTVFTNTALTDDGDVWWEDLTDEPPAHLTDWKGQSWTPESDGRRPRTRTPASACPPRSARRSRPSGRTPRACRSRRSSSAAGAPPPCRSCSSRTRWQHGVLVAATMGSEKTAAATGGLGELRRDPFAMLPFCGYNMGDYFAHWLSMAERTDEASLPAIYGVNWFRKGDDGKFLWPGFGENSRVLEWICRRLDGDAAGADTAIGVVPRARRPRPRRPRRAPRRRRRRARGRRRRRGSASCPASASTSQSSVTACHASSSSSSTPWKPAWDDVTLGSRPGRPAAAGGKSGKQGST